MPNKVYVIGVGMTKFDKPGRRENWDYPDMASDQVHGARRTPESTTRGRAGLRRLRLRRDHVGPARRYELGLTGIPVFNVNNNCSTGSTALNLAEQGVGGGLAECVLALGFEKMEKGSLGSKYGDRDPAHGQAHAGDGELRGAVRAARRRFRRRRS